ncbi:MAG TPA: ribonuclease P protein component, partial [Bacteroidia bacterium]|nr:ribonuclease P protein component [Bacteroidia bacterium]
PFRMVFTTIPYYEEHPVRVGVSAPKRKMKKAVDRNRMKRLMREAFRLNKQPILDYCRQHQVGLAILFISQCNTLVSFRKTEDKIIILLRRLTTENAPTAKLTDDRNDQVL